MPFRECHDDETRQAERSLDEVARERSHEPGTAPCPVRDDGEVIHRMSHCRAAPPDKERLVEEQRSEHEQPCEAAVSRYVLRDIGRDRDEYYDGRNHGDIDDEGVESSPEGRVPNRLLLHVLTR